MAQLHNASDFKVASKSIKGISKPLLIGIVAVIAIACFAGASLGSGIYESDVVIKRANQGSSVPHANGSPLLKSTNSKSSGGSSVLIVDVSGAVKHPCVVRLKSGARVGDAIEAAGGLADDADASLINRAAKVNDGDKVSVPSINDAQPQAQQGTDTVSTASGGNSGTSASQQNGLVNINSATAEQLDTLPGVGPSTAQAIIDDRTQNGPFSSIDDLMRVSGIGEKKFAKLKSGICI